MAVKMSQITRELLCELAIVAQYTKMLSPMELLKASDEFEQTICKRPTGVKWISDADQEKQLEKFVEFANQSYPILHERTLGLCSDFLEFKKVNGSSKEQLLYKDMRLLSLVERLISKVKKYN
jgi:hypothetical protein